MSILCHFIHAADGSKRQLEEALTEFSRKGQEFSSHRFMDELKWGPSHLLSPHRKSKSDHSPSLRINLQNSVIYLSFIPIKPGASCYNDFEQPRIPVASLKSLTASEREAYFKDKFHADLSKIISAGPLEKQDREINMTESKPSKFRKIVNDFGVVAGLGACAWCAVQTGVGVQQTVQLAGNVAPIIHPNLQPNVR